MGWGAFSTAILISAFIAPIWPHLFMKFYSADSGKSLRKLSVLYPLYACLVVPILFIGFAGILAFANAPLENSSRALLEVVMTAADLSPWVIGVMLAGGLAAATSTGAKLVHTAASVLVRDVIEPSLMRRASESTVLAAVRWSVLAILLLAYLVALANPSSLIMM